MCRLYGFRSALETGAEHPHVRERIAKRIDPSLRAFIMGSTDSESCFYLFLTFLAQRGGDLYRRPVRAELALQALEETVNTIRNLADPIAKKPSKLTFLISNGELFLGYRHGCELLYSTYNPECHTCHHATRGRFQQEAASRQVKHLIVSSEKLEEGADVWKQLSDGEYVAIDRSMVFQRGRLSTSEEQTVLA